MNAEEKLDVLKHSRHDWMNVLQLLKTHAALGKVEELQKVIEKTTFKASHEAKLSNVQAPTFAVELITFHWQEHWFSIDFEVEDTFSAKPDDQKWTRFFQGLAAHIDEQAERTRNNHLEISINQNDGGLPCLELDFEGELKSPERLEQWIRKESVMIDMIEYIEVSTEHLYCVIVDQAGGQ